MDHNEDQILEQEPMTESSVETPDTVSQPETVAPVEISDNEALPDTEEAPVVQEATVPDEAPAPQPVADTYIPAPEPVAHQRHPKATKTQRRFWHGVLAAVLTLALVIGCCAVTANAVNEYWTKRTAALEEAFDQKLTQLEDNLAAQIDKIENNGNSVSGSPVSGDGLTPGQVYARNVDSTVLVYSVIQNRGQTSYSTGSGFILTQDGYVVTNYHVVEGGTAFSIVTSDNREYEARMIGGDASNDVAVLKVDGVTLPPVSVGSSDALIVGDQVVAIGNPLGELTSTLTVGYVSAKGRYVTTESTTINMIQTDCAINSGNSGGPLFNMKGEVVGITSAKYSGTTSSGAAIEGIGFAIPIDDVLAIIEDLMEFGYVNSAYLGVQVNNQNEIEAGLPDGAYIVDVTPGYCAEKAGIKAGDYIVELAGHEIKTMNDLTRILRRLDPGTTTTVTVLRNNKKLTLEITLDARPRDNVVTEPQEQMPLPEEGNFDEWYEYFKWFFENEEKP